MATVLRMAAIAAVFAAAVTGRAIAQVCPPGYTLVGGVCQIVGGTVGAAGNVAGSAVGAAGSIVGGTLNATGNIVGGTVGAVTGAPPPACGIGYVYYDGGCYPAR